MTTPETDAYFAPVPAQGPNDKSIPAQDYFAPGTAATNAHGVQYQAEWETAWDGTAIAARLHARALAAQGIPVLLKSFSGVVVNDEGIPEPVFAVGIPESVKAEVGTLPETSIGTLSIILRHLVVRSGASLEGMLMPRHAIHPDPVVLLGIRRAVYDSTITYTVWERDRVSPLIAAQLARCGQSWVPCQQNAAMLVRSGVPSERVHVVPHPYEPTDPICRLTERKPFAARRFYTIGRWEPRKGLDELVGAFMLAFRPGDGATLTIKTTPATWKGYPSPTESVAKWLKVYDHWDAKSLSEHLTIDTRRYPRSAILRLHYQNNIYVAPTRGEAWCLPAFEAKLAGNRVVHVPFGGTADFCGPEDVPVRFDLEPANQSYGWEPDAQWASFTVDALSRGLAKAEAPTAFVRPDYFERRFGFDAVGRQMADLILAQLDGVEPKAAAWLRERRKP